MGIALLGTRWRCFRRRRRRRSRWEFQPVEHAALGSRLFLRALHRLGRPLASPFGRARPKTVEHSPPRLSLDRGLRLASAAAVANITRARILAHLACGSRPGREAFHALPPRPLRNTAPPPHPPPPRHTPRP